MGGFKLFLYIKNKWGIFKGALTNIYETYFKGAI